MKKFMLLLLFVGVVNADIGVALDYDKASANCKNKGFEQSTRQYWDCVDAQRNIGEKSNSQNPKRVDLPSEREKAYMRESGYSNQITRNRNVR